LKHLLDQSFLHLEGVAPFTGAWIETPGEVGNGWGWQSRPSRARGLKQRGKGRNAEFIAGRALHGRVD